MVLDISIIGAGIAGLSAASALAPQGHRIRLYERQINFDHEGWGLIIHPPAAKIIHDLGLDLTALKSVEIDRMFKRGLSDTTLLQDLDIRMLRKDLGVEWPALIIDRADLHAALRAKLIAYPNVSWQFGVEIIRVFADSGIIELADGAMNQADLIVGADGIHSKAIDCVPRPRHQQYISSVVRLPIRINNCVVDVDLALKDASVAEHLRSIEYHRGAGHYTSEKSICLDGPKGSFSTQVMGFFPIRQSRMIDLNFVRPDQSIVSDEREPWTTRLSLEQFLLEARCDRISSILQTLVKSARNFERWTLATRDCPTSFYKGKVVLIGDAAHVSNPSTGTGACLGMEDAVVIGILLRTATVDDLSERLRMYNELRYERCVTVKYFGDTIRPENAGTAAEMLDYLIPGAKLPAPSEFYRYLWKYDPLRTVQEVLEQEHRKHRLPNAERGNSTLELDLRRSNLFPASTLDWIRTLFCKGGRKARLEG